MIGRRANREEYLAMMRVRVRGDGWQGGPSLNTFYFTAAPEDATSAKAAYDRVHAAFTSGNALFPQTVTHTVIPEVDFMLASNGDIVATTSVTGLAVITGSSVTNSIMPPSIAMLLRLTTGTYLEGRRIQGRAFLSPVTQTAAADPDGTPSPSLVSAAVQFGNTLKGIVGTLPPLVVWRRPRVAAVGPPVVTARVGSTAEVTGISVPDKFASLRSRRD